MRILLMKLPLLFLLVGVSRAHDGPVALEFLPPAERAAVIATVEGPAGEQALQIEGGVGASNIAVLICNDPPVSSHQYMVSGRVKYDGVVGDGYLELLNDFGDRGVFFSRALDTSGPLGKLTGRSGWRDFQLPFYAEPGMKPRRLTLNIVLPGAGRVTITQPTLAPLSANSWSASNSWWTEQQAGLLGGVLGGGMGLLGAAIGTLTARKKSRNLILGLDSFGIVVSIVALIAGIVALFAGQLWHVYYPLLMVGVIGGAVLGTHLLKLLRQSRDDELRRITAVDA